MTIDDILEQAKMLSSQERDELVERLIALRDAARAQPEKPKTGAEIVAMLEVMDEPIEFVDSHIEDPVDWVKAQRRKRQEKLKSYRNSDE
ncbi:MAG: hypothetical protein GYB65_01190 [Chloroflexi bacterium]|nr:hypothetical protein [Chloroflexota bacterium]